MQTTRRAVMSTGLAMLAAGTSRAQTSAPVTLQFWEGHSLQEETATIRMIAAFEESHPDIKIQRTKVAFGTNFEKMTTAVASGDLPDVTPIWGGFLPQFAQAGTLNDLRKYGVEAIAPSVYPAAWSYGLVNGGIYGVPYALDPRFLAMNGPALAEAKVSAPATLDELYSVAKALTKRSGDTIARYGIGFASQEELRNAFLNFLYAYGGSALNADETAVTLDTPEGIAAGELMGRLVHDGYATSGLPVDELRHALLGGRVAMMIDGPWILYADSNMDQPIAVDVAPIPRGKAGGKLINVGTVGDYVVWHKSKYPDQAATFVKWMASPEAQQFRVQLLKTSVAPAVVEKPFAKQVFAKWPQLETVQGYTKDSIIYPVQAKWSRIVDALQPAVEAIVSGSDPKTALAEASRQATRALRR